MVKVTLDFPDSVPLDHINIGFLQGMVERMAFGFFNYGHMREQFPARHDALACLNLRLEKYRKTGNTEFLMDAANYAMIEFSRPRLPGAFFRPTTREESPGSVMTTGHVVSGMEEEIALGLSKGVATERCRCGFRKSECKCRDRRRERRRK